MVEKCHFAECEHLLHGKPCLSPRVCIPQYPSISCLWADSLCCWDVPIAQTLWPWTDCISGEADYQSGKRASLLKIKRGNGKQKPSILLRCFTSICVCARLFPAPNLSNCKGGWLTSGQKTWILGLFFNLLFLSKIIMPDPKSSCLPNDVMPISQEASGCFDEIMHPRTAMYHSSVSFFPFAFTMWLWLFT